LSTGSGPANEMAIGDLTGNGNLDLVTANQNDGTVSVFMGNGDGTFQPAVTYSAGSGADAVVAGNFLGNGTVDLAVADYNTNQVTLLGNDGAGVFSTVGTFNVGANPFYIAAGILNPPPGGGGGGGVPNRQHRHGQHRRRHGQCAAQ
jgi:FG-GAP-like repeat